MSVEDALEKIMPGGRALFLAYDQGMEHGPRGFDPKVGNENPEMILKVADKGKFTGVVLLPGDAKKYYDAPYAWETPLILKVNSKSELYQGDDPYSPLLFEKAEDAVDFADGVGATALGYTIYLGSKFEYRMTREFSSLVREAHDRGLPVIAWVYPRSIAWSFLTQDAKRFLSYIGEREAEKLLESVSQLREGLKEGTAFKGQSPSIMTAVSEALLRDCSIEETPTIVAYAASAAARLGADIAKIKYSGDVESFRWAVRCAGRTRVVMSGGPKSGKFLDQVKEVIQAGAAGLAVGRNVWQDPKPLEVAKALREIIWGGAR